MELQESLFSRANSALRAGRLEEAVLLYEETRRAKPELAEQVEFNLSYLRRVVQQGEGNTFVLIAADSVPESKFLPQHDVLLVVLASSLRRAGRTAHVFSRRAGHTVGALVILRQPNGTSVAPTLRLVLQRVRARYALIVTEDAFPAQEWLRYGVEGLRVQGADAVYAQTGSSVSSGRVEPWTNLLAPPSVLISAVGEPETCKRHPIHPDFLITAATRTAAFHSQNPASNGEVHVVEAQELGVHGAPMFTREVCVVIPCIDLDAGRDTANLLLRRAGMPVDIVVAVDGSRQGFIPTLNRTARRSSGRFIVYAAEDAWPGEGWLRLAYESILRKNKKLLAFNCGKWHGRVAAFGMVDKSWAYNLYGDQVLYEGYQSHRADNELTVIARAQDQFVYAPECVLMEHDVEKVFRRSERQAGNFQRSDARLFRERFRNGFGGMVDARVLKDLHDEYLDLPSYFRNRPALNFN